MKEQNPGLLFISGYYPPVNCSTGSVRPWNISKYLSRSGWEVKVATPHPTLWRPELVENTGQVQNEIQAEKIQMIYTGHRLRWLANSRMKCWDTGLGWLLGGLSRRLARLFMVDSWVGWLPEAEKSCLGLSSAAVDLILASGPPFISFELAYRISRRLQRPYLLDYRDLWTSDPHLSAISKGAIRKEKKYLQNCAAISVVSPAIAEKLKADYPLTDKLFVITNGYDANELQAVAPKNFGHFAIVYAGRLIPPVRSIAPLFSALKLLESDPNSSKKEWKFHYYGFDENRYVQNEAEKLGLLQRVVLHGKVPREEALSALKGANLAVVITTSSQCPTLAEKGIITGKIFEMIGLNTPALVITPRGSDIEQIVANAGIGKCFEAGDTGGIVTYLIERLAGKPLPEGERQAYAWSSLSGQLDNLLRSIIDSNKGIID